ncbi:MAG: hypothetical protein ACRENE_16990 [Polyangiaceae bacterium]
MKTASADAHLGQLGATLAVLVALAALLLVVLAWPRSGLEADHRPPPFLAH